MGLSIWQIVLVVILFLLLFGRGKIPALMSDLAMGIKSFKSGMKDKAIDETKLNTADGVEPKATVNKDA